MPELNQQMNNKYLQGIFEPIDFECDINNLEVIGQVPPELNGTLYKIGANPQFIYSSNYHLFDGDGMMHKLNFSNGKVSYSNRWVRTQKFMQEKEAGLAIYAGFRDKAEKLNQIQSGLMPDTVNINIIHHANKLLALNEGNDIYQIDNNLTTVNKFKFDDELSGMTAHPRICAKTGDLVMYSYLSRDIISNNMIKYFVANSKGEIIHKLNIQIPYKSLMHDFAIAGDYVIFPVFPLTCNIGRLFSGGNIYEWEPQRGCYFGIMPRFGTSDDCIWIHQDEPGLAMHVVSAYQEDNLLVMDACYSDNIPDGADGFTPGKEEVFPAYLTRWVFDISNKKIISKNKLNNLSCEFPKIDERYTGEKYNHIYVALTLHSNWFGHEFEGIAHYDLNTNTNQIHDFGKDSIVLEPIFVSKNDNSPEGEGFLLTFVYNKIANQSGLVILDAQNVDKPPLATIKIPHRVPFTFHGTFIPRGK